MSVFLYGGGGEFDAAVDAGIYDEWGYTPSERRAKRRLLIAALDYPRPKTRAVRRRRAFPDDEEDAQAEPDQQAQKEDHDQQE